MKKKHKKKNNFQKRYETCACCLYVGEGDYFCDERGEVIVINYNEPTDGYMGCGGKEWVKQ